MGADFIEKATPHFRKTWDRARVALATADLFTRVPDCKTRMASAEIIGDTKLTPGERLTIEVHGETLIARRGNTEVACFNRPTAAIVQAVKDSCGIAKGTVEQVYARAGVVEISLC